MYTKNWILQFENQEARQENKLLREVLMLAKPNLSWIKNDNSKPRK